MSLGEYLLGQPLVLLAVAGIMLAAAGWMVEHTRAVLGARLRSTGYLAMLGAGALIMIDVARQTDDSDARLDLVPMTEARVSGAETVIPLGADGHYHAVVWINGHEVSAMIDTGASFTSIEQANARKLDLRPSDSRLPAELSTANGVILARFMVAGELRLGSIAVKDAEIAVTPDTAAPQAVIGMNLLSSLAGWRVENGELHLVPKR
ncbi:MAG: TIGR02281 family clan AA aspartic protease [Novosphingobium sp.]